jgi:hypothetical protein
LTSHAGELGSGPDSGNDEVRRLVVAVAAIAKPAHQQHNDGEYRDQNHEKRNESAVEGKNLGLMKEPKTVDGRGQPKWMTKSSESRKFF